MSDGRLLNTRVLVTGASGFLGSRLRDRLLRCGAEVHATSRSLRVSDHPKLHWWPCDLSDPAAARGLLDEIKAETIYHLSGRVTADPNPGLVLPTFSSLLHSTVNVLTAAAEIGCRRLILTGSLTEPAGADASPSSPYAAAKWCANAYGRLFHNLYGTPVVILRPFMTYGPGQDTTKIIPYIMLSLLQGKAPELSSGLWQADWVYIDDVIDGFLAAASRSGIEGCTIDLGTGVLLSIRQVVDHIVSVLQTAIPPLFGVKPDRPCEELRCANTRSAWEKLGWKATTSIQQGLAETAAWLKKTTSESAEGLTKNADF